MNTRKTFTLRRGALTWCWCALLASCGGPADEPAPPPSAAQPAGDRADDPVPLHPLPLAPGEVRPPAIGS